jgi:hypothetical protein
VTLVTCRRSPVWHPCFQELRLEDNLVFSLWAGRLLSSTDKLAIADEMAARHQLKLVTST